MYSDSFDKFVEDGGKVFEGLAVKLSDCAVSGKIKLDIFSLKALRAKAERRLGACVYKMHKSGATKSEEKENYIRILDDLNKSIDALESLD